VAGQASNITRDFVKRIEDWNGDRPMSKFIPTVVCFLLGNSQLSEFYMPTFRNTLFHLHRRIGMKLNFLNILLYAICFAIQSLTIVGRYVNLLFKQLQCDIASKATGFSSLKGKNSGFARMKEYLFLVSSEPVKCICASNNRM